jgi:fumarylacetoacetase
VIGYGVDHDGHVLLAQGDQTIDLARVPAVGVDPQVWASGSLNAFFALGPQTWSAVYERLQDLDPPPEAIRTRPQNLRLPFAVADYVDFYASEEHATNMGHILRPGSEPLPKAWKHLPIGYHGRSGTVIVSGDPVPRPHGLRGPGDFGPTARLDLEVELGFVVGQGSPRGRPVTVDAAPDHIFGVVLLNDWSARDIQSFEYVPLGPFLGKSFATQISPWVVPLAALEPFRTPGPRQYPEPAGYLRQSQPGNYDIRLELALNGTTLSCAFARGLYWSAAQQIAHLTVNGASLRPGDLVATGTISGPGVGSLIELTNNGESPITLDDGTSRIWLEDGDEVVIRGWCGDGALDIGEVRGRIVP